MDIGTEQFSGHEQLPLSDPLNIFSFSPHPLVNILFYLFSLVQNCIILFFIFWFCISSFTLPQDGPFLVTRLPSLLPTF
jgi:hypothetical protein